MADTGEVTTDSGDSKKPSRLEAVESAIEAMASALGTISNQVSDLARMNPGQLRRAESPEAMLQADPTGKEAQRSRMVKDYLNPRGPLDNFQPEDVVSVKPGSDLEKTMRTATSPGGSLKYPENTDLPLGQILTYMYTARNGHPKYKVHFKGWGQDGCTQDNLELLS